MASATYEERVRFLFKTAEPFLWGVRDGDYKFVEKPGDEGSIEVFHIASDPHERTNLAALHTPSARHKYVLLLFAL